MRTLPLLFLLAAFTAPVCVNAQTFYGTLSSTALIKLDLAACNSTFLGNSDSLLYDIAVCPDRRLYAIDEDEYLYEVDTLNGHLSLINYLNLPRCNNLVCDSVGNLLTVSQNDSLYQISRFTGAPTALGYVGYGSAGDLTFYHDTLYLSASFNKLVKISLPVVSAQLIGTMNAPSVFGLNTFCFNNIETMVATGGNFNHSNLYAVDPLTASLTLLCDTIEHDLIFGAASLNDAGNQAACITTRIEEIFFDVNVNAFPNPVTTHLTVETTNASASEIILYDIFSRELLRHKFIRSATLNMHQLSKGMYLYEVRSKNGAVKKGKVVKE